MWSHRGKDAPILPGDKVRIDPQLSRRVLLAVSTLLLFGTVLAVLIIVLIWSSSKHDDRLAVISNWLGAGTLALAVFAGLVALRAYAVATGPPDLKFKVQFADLPPNVLTIARESRDLHGPVAGEVSQTSISLKLVFPCTIRANTLPAIRLLSYGSITRGFVRSITR